MVTVTRQAANRLADIDVEQYIVIDGVKLIRAASGRYYAESRSAPRTLWFLTGFSCQCPAFIYRQTCRHHRALMWVVVSGIFRAIRRRLTRGSS